MISEHPIIRSVDSIYSVTDRIDIFKNRLNYLDTLNNQRDSTAFWGNRYNMYRIALNDTAMVNNDTIVENFMDSCYSSDMGLLLRSVEFIQDTVKTSKGQLTTQRDSLTNVSSSWVTEAEFANALSKEYDLYISDTVSSSNETYFRDMADNCPYDDGMAVYISREAVAYMDDFAPWQLNSCEFVSAPPSSRLAGGWCKRQHIHRRPGEEDWK